MRSNATKSDVLSEVGGYLTLFVCAWKLCIDVVLNDNCDGQQLVRYTMKIYKTMQSSTDTLSLLSVQLSQKGRTEAPRCVRISEVPFLHQYRSWLFVGR
jgi:hypothetical protein